MTRFNFNYKTASGIGSLVLEKCAETFFKQFKLLGNSVQQETPSPEFPQEIKNVGKYNEDTGKYEVLVNINNSGYLQKGSYANKVRTFPLEKGKTYRIYVGVNSKVVNAFILNEEKTFINSSDLYVYCNTNGLRDENSTGVISGECKIPSLLINGYTFYVTVDGLCLYQGVNNSALNTDNAYITYDIIKKVNLGEPYKEQTVKLSLDQPLRGIGEHKDEVTKDGVVRKIKQITLNGSEDWTLHNNTSKEKTQSFGLVIPVKCYAANVGLKSNRFLKRYTVWMGDIEGIDIYSGRTLYINIEKTKASNVEEFKKWLSENQVTVEVVLVEPIIEPLAEESKKALESLYTNNGTTVIAVDGGEVEAKIEVEYAVKE